MSHQFDLPLTRLVAFAAAARASSFKQAAATLNVTPGAVSHQIKALERDLGVPLFARHHRAVVLTEDGQDLMVSVQAAFDDMSRALDRIRRPGPDDAVTIAATSAVSALWLTPRITRFWRDYPQIRINQIVADGPVRAGLADLVIYYGEPGADSDAYCLFRDVLVPVAASALAAGKTGISLPDLAALPLIHLNAPDQRWTTWKAWFAMAGHAGPVARGMQVNNYMIALQAAQDGVGVVLGWERLVRPLLDNGTLAVLGDFRQPAPAGFYLQRRPASLSDGRVTQFVGWLLDQVN